MEHFRTYDYLLAKYRSNFMTIPRFEDCMQPILELTSDTNPHTNRECIQHITKLFKLTIEEQSLLIPSGIRPSIDDRVLWALFYLKRAEFIESVSRGVFKSTRLGLEILQKRKKGEIPPLTVGVLISESKAFEEWFHTKVVKRRSAVSVSSAIADISTKADVQDDHDLLSSTPLQRLEEAYGELMDRTISDLIDKMAKLDDREFEIFIAGVLPKLGYGKDPNDIIKKHGGPGDGGIDGIVQLDALGAEKVFIQAKHWKAQVDLPPVVEFSEKVHNTGVKAGVFVALSGFDKNATKYIAEHQVNIAWIDSKKLAEVMISKGVGVIEDSTYKIFRVDDDYFNQSND